MGDRSTGEAWVVVVAAGSGRRFGAAKQFSPLAGDTVLGHAVRTAAAVADGVVAVVPAGHTEAVPSATFTVAGSTTRAGSVRAGLAEVPPGVEVIAVHDGARPLASQALFTAVIGAVRAGAAAAIPVVPVVDSLRRHDGAAVDRDELVAVQTPQAFRADVLRRAHSGGGDATDDAALVEAIGERVEQVDGERWNLKITEPADLPVAEALLRQRVRR